MTFLAAAAVAVAFAAPGAAQAACVPAVGYENGSATSILPNDPLFSAQWGLQQIKAPAAWSRGAFGTGATIAIVDTGVDLGHPDLVNNLLPGANFVSGDSCNGTAQDLNGHGTHVAGIAAASTNNGIGIAGTAPGAKILPVRVLGSDGTGNGGDIANGIRWAADQGAQVINLSLGGDMPLIDTTGLGPAVDYAWSKGAVIVAAAGNSTLPLCGYPAASAHAICVAATDSSGFPTLYSNFPVRLDGGVAVRAPGGTSSFNCSPGQGIWSTYWPGASGNDAEVCRPNGYEPLAGTSMAAPFVSGLAAMLRAAGQSNQQTVDCIRATSSNNGSFDPIYGYGIINADNAVAKCAHLTGSGSQFPSTTGSSGQSAPSPTSGVTPPPPAPPPSNTQGQVLSETSHSDTTPPKIRMTIPKRKGAHVARAGYITVRVRLSETAKLWLQVRNGRETQAVSRNAVVLAGTLTTVRGGKARDLKLKLTKAGKRVIRLHRALRVTLIAYAQDASKNNGTAIAEGRIRR